MYSIFLLFNLPVIMVQAFILFYFIWYWFSARLEVRKKVSNVKWVSDILIKFRNEVARQLKKRKKSFYVVSSLNALNTEETILFSFSARDLLTRNRLCYNQYNSEVLNFNTSLFLTQSPSLTPTPCILLLLPLLISPSEVLSNLTLGSQTLICLYFGMRLPF